MPARTVNPNRDLERASSLSKPWLQLRAPASIPPQHGNYHDKTTSLKSQRKTKTTWSPYDRPKGKNPLAKSSLGTSTLDDQLPQTASIPESDNSMHPSQPKYNSYRHRLEIKEPTAVPILPSTRHFDGSFGSYNGSKVNPLGTPWNHGRQYPNVLQSGPDEINQGLYTSAAMTGDPSNTLHASQTSFDSFLAEDTTPILTDTTQLRAWGSAPQVLRMSQNSKPGLPLRKYQCQLEIWSARPIPQFIQVEAIFDPSSEKSVISRTLASSLGGKVHPPPPNTRPIQTSIGIAFCYGITEIKVKSDVMNIAELQINIAVTDECHAGTGLVLGLPAIESFCKDSASFKDWFANGQSQPGRFDQSTAFAANSNPLDGFAKPGASYNIFCQQGGDSISMTHQPASIRSQQSFSPGLFSAATPSYCLDMPGDGRQNAAYLPAPSIQPARSSLPKRAYPETQKNPTFPACYPIDSVHPYQQYGMNFSPNLNRPIYSKMLPNQRWSTEDDIQSLIAESPCGISNDNQPSSELYTFSGVMPNTGLVWDEPRARPTL